MSTDNSKFEHLFDENNETEGLSESALIAKQMLTNFDPYGLPQDNVVRAYADWDCDYKRRPLTSSLNHAALNTVPRSNTDTASVVLSRPGDMFRVVTKKGSSL